MGSEEKWDAYVRLAQDYVRTGNLAEDEINYKLDIGSNTAAARKAVLNGDDGWAALLRSALISEHPIPWRGYVLPNFNQWCIDHPAEAQRALQEIWTEDELSTDQRIRAFSSRFPPEVVSGAGTRVTVASALLMGLNVERYPPFRTRKFEDAYRFIGYRQPQNKTDESALYRHALDFLDRLIQEAEARGLDWPYRHRLAAQSVVWQISRRVEKLLESQKSKRLEEPPIIEQKTIAGQQPSLPTLAHTLLFPQPFLEEIDTLLKDKRQVIFQGPPGTGKTFVAQKLAICLAGSKDRVTLVQFHPSYAYEDFVRGFRPTLKDGKAGYELQDGPLLRAAEKARNDEDHKHFLIIDEINRGNLAKVFGELYFLLEYRDEKISLQYQRKKGETFSLPDNLYIIGTMNTADRSIALVDLALRRRFYFIEFHPDEEPVKDVLRKWLERQMKEGKASEDIDWVADVVEEANKLLEKDKHAAIGPSYFMKENLNEEFVRRIWKHSVLPYIEERLIGDDDRLSEFDLDKLIKKADHTREQKQDAEQTENSAEGEGTTEK